MIQTAKSNLVDTKVDYNILGIKSFGITDPNIYITTGKM